MDDSEGAIYVPPKDGLPFLVVTHTEDGWKAQPTSTRSEARVLLGRRTRRAKLAAHVAAESLRLAK